MSAASRISFSGGCADAERRLRLALGVLARAPFGVELAGNLGLGRAFGLFTRGAFDFGARFGLFARFAFGFDAGFDFGTRGAFGRDARFGPSRPLRSTSCAVRVGARGEDPRLGLFACGGFGAGARLGLLARFAFDLGQCLRLLLRGARLRLASGLPFGGGFGLRFLAREAEFFFGMI